MVASATKAGRVVIVRHCNCCGIAGRGHGVARSGGQCRRHRPVGLVHAVAGGGDESVAIQLTGTIPSGRDGDILIRHGNSDVGGTATRSADSTCSLGEDFVFLAAENDAINPSAGDSDPVYSWTDIQICKDNTAKSAETITLVWSSVSGTPFDSSQSHCDSTSSCAMTVTIYDSQSITLDAANYQAEEGTAMPVTITVDPAASIDRTFTLETAETGTGAASPKAQIRLAPTMSKGRGI